MKFKDKFGNDVECTPDEYRVLMGLAHEEDSEPVEKSNVTVIPMAFPVKGSGKLSGGSSGKKWSGKDKKLLRLNSDKPIDFLMKLFPNRSAGAILVKLKKIGRKRPVIVVQGGKKGNSKYCRYSSDELKLLSKHRKDSPDSLEKLLPNHPIGSIIDKLHTLYGRSKSYPKRKDRHISHGSVWTASDLKVLRDNLDNMDNARLLLAGKHSVGSVNVYASRLRKSLNKIVAVKNSGKPYKHGKNHGNYSRMKFLNTRAKYYMDNFNWSRDKAYGQASEDWKSGKPIGTVASDELVFKVVKFDFASQKYVVVDVFSVEDDAKKCLAESRIADKTINGGAQFSIVKVVKGSKGDVGDVE
jgi:hypothetical protein